MMQCRRVSSSCRRGGRDCILASCVCKEHTREGFGCAFAQLGTVGHLAMRRCSRMLTRAELVGSEREAS